ncbi:hypothetical protein GJ496_010587 [Pomphorhynchus laevis]|nr:hypothetical protein GJ496_010587 [Pomphorhynchus laevis]
MNTSNSLARFKGIYQQIPYCLQSYVKSVQLILNQGKYVVYEYLKNFLTMNSRNSSDDKEIVQLFTEALVVKACYEELKKVNSSMEVMYNEQKEHIECLKSVISMLRKQYSRLSNEYAMEVEKYENIMNRLATELRRCQLNDD